MTPDLRTSLVEVLSKAICVELEPDEYVQGSVPERYRRVAEIAADVVLERLERVGIVYGADDYDREVELAVGEKTPVYRWREPDRETEEVG